MAHRSSVAAGVLAERRAVSASAVHRAAAALSSSIERSSAETPVCFHTLSSPQMRGQMNGISLAESEKKRSGQQWLERASGRLPHSSLPACRRPPHR
eukprot:scaffold13352_cov30-Tisochrysis_lutea.AAC.1